MHDVNPNVPKPKRMRGIATPGTIQLVPRAIKTPRGYKEHKSWRNNESLFLFIPLTPEEESAVTAAFEKDIIVKHEKSNIQIPSEKLQCLKPGGWLNDEVINLYLCLFKEREEREPQKFLKCHFFSTYFYAKISGIEGYDYNSVSKWTDKIGYELLECDKIFVPINNNIHWTLAVINKKDKTLQYLDPMKRKEPLFLDILNNLSRYYEDEVHAKSATKISLKSWKREFVKNRPMQENGNDCGMFIVKYVDFYSRNLNLCFKQTHMDYFRRRMVKEILDQKAV